MSRLSLPTLLSLLAEGGTSSTRTTSSGLSPETTFDLVDLGNNHFEVVAPLTLTVDHIIGALTEALGGKWSRVEGPKQCGSCKYNHWLLSHEGLMPDTPCEGTA